MDNLKEKVKSGFIWETSTKLVIQTLSWASTILVARWLTPEDYGIVAVSGVFVVFFTVFAEMGFTAGLVNKKHISDTETNGVFWLGLLVSVALTFIMILISPLIEMVFEMPGLSRIIMASSSVFVIASLRCIPTALVLRDLNYRYRTLVDMVAQSAQVVTVLPMAYFGFGPWSLVCSAVVMQLVTTLAYFPQIRGVGRLSFNWHEIREVVTYGGKVMISRISSTLAQMAPTFLVGLILGQKSAGEYSIAGQLGQMPLSKVGTIFNRILFPAASRIKEDTSRSREVFFKFHRVLLMCAFPLLTGTVLIAHDVILLVFTEKWIAIVPILQIICLLNLVKVSAMIMTPMLTGMGKPGAVVRYNFILLVLIPLASFVGLQWGLRGMLISWVVVHPIAYAYMLVRLKRCLNFKLMSFIRSFYSVIVSTLVMITALLFVQSTINDLSLVFRLLLLIMLGGAIYVGVYFVLFRSEMNELVATFQKREAYSAAVTEQGT